MWNFNRQHVRAGLIGIEKTESTIRMLQLGGGAGEHVVACAEWVATGGGTLDTDVPTIETMLADGGFSGRRAAAVVGYSDISFETINVMASASDNDMIVEAVREACEVNGLEGCIWPLSAVLPTSSDGPMRVILLQASHETVARWRRLVSDSGISVTSFLPRPLAAFQALTCLLRRRSDQQHTQVLVDIGEQSAAILAASGGQPYFAKQIPGGEREFSRVAGKQLSLPIEDIRQLRRQISQSRGGRGTAHLDARSDSLSWALFDACRETYETFVFEVSLAIKHCQTTFGMPKPSGVWLSGEAAEDISIHHLLRSRMDIDVHVLSPLRGLNITRSLLAEDRRGALAEWASCVGAARQDQSRERLAVGGEGRTV